MFLKTLVAVLALGFATAAHAQSPCAAIVYGAVLTPGQWNNCFTIKQDTLGFTPVNRGGDTMTGRLVSAPSTLTQAGFVLAPGAVPSAPLDGALWTTTSGLFVRINGSTVSVGGTGPGLANQLAFYATSGNSISGLVTANNGVLVTSGIGVPSISTTLPSGLAMGTPASINLTNGTVLPLSGLAAGTQDHVLGYFSSTAVSAGVVPNCSNALTYSTSTHLFGCNTLTGTGTVTSVGLANSYGLSVSGSPITSSGNITAGVSLSTLTNSPLADVALNNTSAYFDGPSVAQGTSGTWFVSGTVTLDDVSAASLFYCKLWDGTNVLASGATNTPGATGLNTISLSGEISSPSGNLRISCRDVNTTSGFMLLDASGNGKDSRITAVRIQ